MRPLVFVLPWIFSVLVGCQCEDAPAPKQETRAENPSKPSVPPASGPNVLVIVWDTTRADHLSTYGYPLQTTPRLDKFASEGIVYERAVSPGMWTLPSHASMFTGMPVSAHGAVAGHKFLDLGFTTMAESFRDGGYGTYLFAANPYLQDHTNLTQGFDKTEYPWDPRWKSAAKKATLGKLIDRDASNSLGPKWEKSKYSTGRTNDRVKDAGTVTADALMTWLEERESSDRPFLAVLNYMEAHVPRIPSMESRQALFDEDTIEKQLALDQAFPFLLAHTLELHDFTQEQLEIIASTYDASLRDQDQVTGVLFDRLDAAGILDDTIVVITSDHGEHLGEHHRIGHKYSVYNPLVRVPLVIRYPKKLQPARVDKVVSNLHIWGTISELTGVPLPEGVQSRSLLDLDSLPDHAVSELVRPTPQAFIRMRKVHPRFDSGPWEYTYTAVEGPDAKCIERSDGARALYDMTQDVLESTDLAGDDPARTEEVCGLIEPWKSSFKMYRSDGTRDPGKVKRMSDEERARLEVLGYVDEEVPSQGKGAH